MDLVHTYKSILSSHKPCSQLILTELLFFFSLFFLSCPSLGGRGWLSPILLPANQWQCLAIKLMKCFSVLPKFSYGKIKDRSNIHLKTDQCRENGECINHKNDPLAVVITPFIYLLIKDVFCATILFPVSQYSCRISTAALDKRHLKMTLFKS